MAAIAHIADVVEKMRERITPLSTQFASLKVEITNPAYFQTYAANDPLVTIFVYRVSPDHAAMVATPNSAMAMRIHVLVTAFCKVSPVQGEAPGSEELRIISHILRLFHEKPMLGPVRIREAVPVGPLVQLLAHDIHVEAQLKPLDMEELNHIWTTQAQTPYRTSLVFELVHAFVTPAQPSDEGPPVLRTEMAWRDQPADPWTPGIAPYLAVDNAPAKPPQAVLAFNTGTGPAPVLTPAMTRVRNPAQPAISVTLAAVAETAEPLTLSLARWDAATLAWVAVAITAPAPATMQTQARATLAGGAALAGTAVSFAMPAEAGVYRLSAEKTGAPAALAVNSVTLTVEEP